MVFCYTAIENKYTHTHMQSFIAHDGVPQEAGRAMPEATLLRRPGVRGERHWLQYTDQLLQPSPRAS